MTAGDAPSATAPGCNLVEIEGEIEVCGGGVMWWWWGVMAGVMAGNTNGVGRVRGGGQQSCDRVLAG